MNDRKTRNDPEYKALKRENRRLRHRIEELEAENARLRSDIGLKSGGDGIATLWWLEGRRERLMSVRNYPKYLISLVKSTSFWLLCQRGLSFFRKFRLISWILRIVTRIVIWAETSVAFIAWISATIVILPFLALLSAASLFIALFRSKNANKHFEELLGGKKVYILFASKKQLSKRGEKVGFFVQNVRELALRDSVCIVVSPHFFGREGIGGSDFYVTARKESENIYMVRKNYYFMLRRVVIERVASEIICIY